LLGDAYEDGVVVTEILIVPDSVLASLSLADNYLVDKAVTVNARVNDDDAVDPVSVVETLTELFVIPMGADSVSGTGIEMVQWQFETVMILIKTVTEIVTETVTGTVMVLTGA